MARINVVCAVMPELEVPPGDTAFVLAFLARAFAGFTLVKEAQADAVARSFPGTNWQGKIGMDQ